MTTMFQTRLTMAPSPTPSHSRRLDKKKFTHVSSEVSRIDSCVIRCSRRGAVRCRWSIFRHLSTPVQLGSRDSAWDGTSKVASLSTPYQSGDLDLTGRSYLRRRSRQRDAIVAESSR
ncbi:hypothetical protein MTO96_022978 [Rhipicephalus appendiculatus]